MFISPFRNSMLAFSQPMFDDDPDGGGGGNDNGRSTGKDGKNGKDKGDKGFEPITTQEDFDAKLSKRLEQLRRSMKGDVRDEVEEELREELAAEAAKENEDYKALYEAAQKKVDKYEAEEKQRDHDALREKVAKEAGLPESSMKFLTGDNEKELKASAKELSELVTPKKADDTDTGKTYTNGGENRRKEKQEEYEDPNFWLSGS